MTERKDTVSGEVMRGSTPYRIHWNDGEVTGLMSYSQAQSRLAIAGRSREGVIVKEEQNDAQ